LILILYPPSKSGDPFKGWRRFFFLSFVLCLLLIGCWEDSDTLSEPEKYTRVYDFQEKYIFKAITTILKERGFSNPMVDAEKGKVETDYFAQGNLRTRVEATVKKIGRKEREVTLSVITEKKKSPGDWKLIKILDKSHYEKFFDEIEMQIYREIAKGD
jgi:hypothetical protein